MDSLNVDRVSGAEQITVLFFATLKERAGTRQAVVELQPGTSVRDLKARLGQIYPGLREMTGSMLVSVNKEFAFDEDKIPAGAEVAIFPPVSGGSVENTPTIFAITEEELDLDDLLKRITLPSTGAACIFTGMVRGITERGDPHETVYLEYEAYLPMAEAKMHQVAEEIRARWDSVEGIAIVQRIGRLYPKTPTVLIACTAAHRDTGVFEAARYGIDRLKEIVPVWKKEVGPQGEEWVEGDYFPGRND
jgi:molybdopterin synthase catalytic subunit